MHRQRKKQRIIYLLVGILLIMAVGYSAFSSNLKITGNTKITSNWDVEITGISAPTISGSAEEVSVPTYDKLSANMNVNLYEPGDSIEYDVTVSNLGTIDATLDNYTLGTSTNSMIVTFSNFTKGEIIYKRGHSNSTKDIHVKIEYNPEYTGGEISEETSITFTFKEPEVKELTNDEVISKDKYLVTYDCTTNGGTSCTSFNEYLLPGDTVDLTKEPNISGYRFIGWNTNSSASTGLSSYTMSSNNVTMYAILESLDNTPPVIDSVSTVKSPTSITVVATAHDDETGISKYEFSSDNGTSWQDNGTNGTYTFSNLTTGNTYQIKVRVTNGTDGKTTSDTYNVIPSIPVATFQEFISDITEVEITYPEECSSGTYTCTYQKNSDSAVTVNSSNLNDNKINIEFTESGTLIATVSDGTNTVSSTYTVTYVAGDTATVTEIFSTAGRQEWTVPATGEYYLQVWGAQGGTYSSKAGGLGGYSYGTVTLNKNDTLYIYTGGQGTTGTSGGGYNGGGSVGSTTAAGGGGASDIRINSDSLYARVIVAGGGGGSGQDSCATATTGYGGGLSGGGGASQGSCGTQGAGGTQTSGGIGGLYSSTRGTSGSFGQGGTAANGSYDGGGGGGGWYGGGSGASAGWSNGAGGGSGYVYTASTASNYPSGCLLNSSYYLKDAATIAGNTSFESPSGGTETGHAGNGYVKISYEINNSVSDKSTLAVNSVTTNTISVSATPKSGLNVTKYEFSKDNGSTWTNNGTNSSYTFTGLTHNTTYNIKVRLTTSEGKVVNSIEAKTNELMIPTFSDANGTNSINTTITYMSGCGSTYTCTYKKNNDSPVNVNSNTATVNFTSTGTLTATISDGTNTLSDTHTPTESSSSIPLSLSTSKTTSTITVTASASAPTGISKYEFQVDGGQWKESANNVYTFDKLTTGTHTVNSRVTTNFGTVKTGTQVSVTMNTITAPTYKVEYKDVDDGDVTITYPSGCGSTFTCTYIKNSESPVTVTSTTALVNFSADGELAASITDGTNTVSNSFTVTMPVDVIDDYGVNMPVVGAGDGLYTEEYGEDDTAYFYRGANPNNYITLGADTYRIMSIDTSGNLKVIKDTPLSSMVWDPGYSTSITGITSSSSTAGTRYSSASTDYCYASSASSYYGCKSWGSKTSTLNSAGTSAVTQMPWEAGSSTLKNLPTYDSYMNVYLNGGTYPTTSGTTTLTSWYSSNVDSGVQSKMVEHLWNIGPVSNSSSYTLTQNIGQEAAYKWRGKVGLMTATDYMRASTNSACTNVYSYSYNNNTACYNNSSTHNWLYKNSNQWTMVPYSHSSAYGVWGAYLSGYLSNSYAYNTYGVRPVFYLTSSIHLKGKGTADSPYYIYTPPTTAAKATLTKLGQSSKEYGTIDGDGIYEDNEGGYYYRGANPYNYINLGSDLYRIMSIDTDGNLKVIKDTPLYSMAWDTGYSASITGITPSSSTAGTRYSSASTDYCYASSASSYYGCKSWGSKTSTLNSAGTSAVTQMPWEAGSSTLKNLPTYDSYINVYLNGGTYPTESGTTTLTSWYSSNVDSGVQSKMVEHLWNIGPVASSTSYTLTQNIEQEAAYKWRGKVGLMTVTDYVRASTKSECTNVYSYRSDPACYGKASTHNWLNKNNTAQWTMVPYSYSSAYRVWIANSSGDITDYSAASGAHGVRPVLYLSSSISITGSSGGPFSPFTAS